MKSIISKLNTETTIDINEITNESYVGIQFSNKEKYIIINTLDSELENVYTSSSLEDEDLSGNWTRKTKNRYVKECLKQIGANAYRFDTKKEMLNWLIN